GAGGTDQEDVRLLDFNIGAAAPKLNALVVLINRNSQPLLGFILSNHILVKKAFDLARFGQRRTSGYRLSLLIIGDDLVADVDTLIADVDRRAGNEFLNFVLGFTAEGTAQCVV